MKKIAFLLVLILPFLGNSQTNDWYYYETPTSYPIDSQYNIELKQEYKKAKFQYKSKGKVEKRNYQRFAEVVSYGKWSRITQGDIYYNLPKVEAYVNTVLQKILPEELKGKPQFHAYITRYTDVNAFAIHDGTFYCNIGILAELDSEAELAYLMGHELSHYLNNDSRDGFMKAIKGQSKLKKLIPGYSNFAQNSFLKNSREQETEADKKGYNLAFKAGYKPQGALDLENLLLGVHKKYALQSNGKYKESKARQSTHPSPENRLRKTLDMIKGTGNVGEMFLQSEDNFNSVSNISKQELLNELSRDNSFLRSIEQGLKEYIASQNPVVAGYIANQIRKLLYIYPYYKDKGFLTSHFSTKKIDAKKGILHTPEYLIQDTAYLAKYNQVINDLKPKLNNYVQAYNYFSQLALKNDVTENYLTMALYNYKSQSKSKKYINQYLSKKDAIHTSYAKSFLKNKLQVENKNKLIYIYDINKVSSHVSGYSYHWQESIKAQKKQLKLIKSKVKDSGYNANVQFISKAYKENPKKVDDIIRVMNLSTFLKKQQIHTDLTYYSPEIYNTLSENNISSIDIYGISTMDRKFKKLRHLWLIPPITTIGIYMFAFGNTRYKFKMYQQFLNVNPNTKAIQYDYGIDRGARFSDKKLARKVYKNSKFENKYTNKHWETWAIEYKNRLKFIKD